MKIQSIQKVIKVGDSKAVTLPARDLKVAGIDTGDDVKVTVESLRKKTTGQGKLMREYEAFKQQYGQTLKNLSDR